MTPPYFCIFVIISPLKRTCPFIWTNLNSLHPRMICTKFDRNWSSGSGEEDFLNFLVYFCFFAIISPCRKALPFIWTKLNPLAPRMICSKFGWNWPSGSGEEVENVKVYRQTDRQTDDGRSEKLTWAFSSGELKTKRKKKQTKKKNRKKNRKKKKIKKGLNKSQ